MHWKDYGPRPAIDLAAAAASVSPGPAPVVRPEPFLVRILKVAQGDPLPLAFTEFWRRALTESFPDCSDHWQVMLIQMNLPGGGFSLVFTNDTLDRDEPPVFKLSSEALEHACNALPAREPGDPRAEVEYQQLEDGCLKLLRDAARSEPVVTLLAHLQARRKYSIRLCDFYRTKWVPLNLD